ncbi:MAG: tRNA (5-methylaminomethyl-2-thiouridine)(34)-methyltransferase MnmD [Saprospiraceae bacterium]|nr:tRNA (5-methylaminomethyl-2-thiouridine)(34)-methyltransferase MnmD [Saprospiraceae bacterium]
MSGDKTTPVNQTFQLIQTADGSRSIHDLEFGVPFHSIHGAVTESRHVFVAAGLHHTGAAADYIHVLEVGFGTGLNALLAAIWAREHEVHVCYTGIEPRPLPRALIPKLGYPQVLNEPEPTLAAIHDALRLTDIHPFFKCRVVHTTLKAFRPEDQFNLVFYDAFAPNAQPEMWSRDTLQYLAGMLAPDAVLVTYCAQGQFKRHLRSVGFTVEPLPGPPGKREMVRATFRPA